MKKIVIYDSRFGNTEKISRAIGQALGSDTNVVRLSEVHQTDLQTADLIIVGSPTQGGRATPAIQNFINSIPAAGLNNIKIAAFDTRFSEKDSNFALRLLIKTIGYAADKIAKLLLGKGGKLAIQPEGFIVIGKAGPLKNGELERAEKWTKTVQKNLGAV